MKENNVTGYDIFGRIAFFILLLILLPFVGAFLFQYSWNTILAHIFPIKQITLVQAYAISIIVNYYTDHTPTSKEKPEWKRSIGLAIGKWLIMLLILWILHFFV